MVVYLEDRFRNLSVKKILKKLRKSSIYHIQTDRHESEEVSMNFELKNTKDMELWNGTHFKDFYVHRIHIHRDINAGYLSLDENDIKTLVREEMKKILKTDVSFPPKFQRENLFLGYDALTKNKERPMERISLLISKYSLMHR